MPTATGIYLSDVATQELTWPADGELGSGRLVFLQAYVRRAVRIVYARGAARSDQGGYIFYARASLAGAGYCRQCRRRPAILPLQLWQGCQVCVKISAQRLP